MKYIKIACFGLLLASSTAGAASYQRMLQKAGWIPIDRFDLVKIKVATEESANAACNSATRPKLLGAMMQAKALERHGIFRRYSAIQVMNSLATALDASACYDYGADLVKEDSYLKIGLTDASISDFVRLSGSASYKDGISLDHLVKAHLEFDGEQRLKLLQRLDSIDQNGSHFVVSDVLIGDLKDEGNFRIDAGGKVKFKDLDINVTTLEVGSAEPVVRLSGKSLALAVRGFYAKAGNRQKLMDFDLPDVGGRVELDQAAGLPLTILMTAPGKMDVRLGGGANLKVYKLEKGLWRVDQDSYFASAGGPATVGGSASVAAIASASSGSGATSAPSGAVTSMGGNLGMVALADALRTRLIGATSSVILEPVASASPGEDRATSQPQGLVSAAPPSGPIDI